jgi:hypothetical protein
MVHTIHLGLGFQRLCRSSSSSPSLTLAFLSPFFLHFGNFLIRLFNLHCLLLYFLVVYCFAGDSFTSFFGFASIFRASRNHGSRSKVPTVGFFVVSLCFPSILLKKAKLFLSLQNLQVLEFSQVCLFSKF